MNRALPTVISLAMTALACRSPTPPDRAPTALALPRGYYKALQSLDARPQAGHRELDALRFGVDDDDRQKQEQRAPYYLAADPLLIPLPPPPANSSAQTQAELDYLIELQRRRSEEDVRSSLAYAKVWYDVATKPGDPDYPRFQHNLFHIGRSIGTWFNAESLPLTRQLVANLWRDANYFIWHYKVHYDRIRPYRLERALQNLEETDWPAYPSGHAGNSYVAAYVYSELAPEFADVFLKDALDMAHSREILGVHYPSDSEAARVLARKLVDQLLRSPRFQRDLAAARGEWARVRAQAG
jgi:acid phosphatase (class A)